MANWRPVDVRLWNDRKFLAGGDDARLLWLFLLTCPSLPIPGVVVGGDAALAELLGWTPERLRERFAELARNGLRVRREARVVWLQNALKYQPPANPNMVKSWGKKWDDVPEGELKLELWEALRIACKSWSVLFGKLFTKPSSDGSWNGFANGSRNGSTHEHQHKHQHQHDHDLEDQSSRSASARAIPPSTEQAPVPQPPAAPHVPAVSPPEPAREDIARTRQSFNSAPPTAPAERVDARREPTAIVQPQPSAGYDPNDPRAGGRLAEMVYRRVSDARIAIAAELGLAAPLPFPPVTPGSHPRALVELQTRIRESGALAVAVTDRVVENLIAQAREERSLEWLAEKAFGDKAWPRARDWKSAAERAAAAAARTRPPAAAIRKPNPPPPLQVSTLTPEERIAAAAEARAQLYGQPAALPTSELVKRFGDGPRAPPRGVSGASDDTDEKQQNRRGK